MLYSDLFNTEKIYSKASLEKCIAWGDKEGLLQLLNTNENVSSSLNTIGWIL
jgi:hypothetical protein